MVNISKYINEEKAIMNGTSEFVPKKKKEEIIDFNSDESLNSQDNDYKEYIDHEEEERLLETKRLIGSSCCNRVNNNIVIDCDIFLEDFSKLYEWFLDSPREFLIMLKTEIKDRFGLYYPVKFENLGYGEEISNIRVEHISKIVKVTGMITNSTSINSLTVSGRYECPSCGSIITVHGPGEPKRCSCGRTSKNGSFILCKNGKEYMDIQELFVEETYDNLGMKTPKKVRVRLLDDLCDKEMNEIIIPGTKIEVIGVAEVVPMNKKNPKINEEINEYRIHALQVKSLENEFDDTISDEDIEEFNYIANHEPSENLSKSIAPNIKGRDNEKLGLLLAMVRGNPEIKKDGREDKDTIHILLVGDAGQGKTDMTTACMNLHYKCIYADCIGMTEPALTAMAEQDKLTNAWGLKPGLMVRANGGMVILDEFDKAKDEAKNALHTVTESKIVTINKAAINTSLKADCTILLCANPKNSRFDMEQSVVDQINLPPTILTRMDLIFTLMDPVDEDQDGDIADSILDLTNDNDEFIPIDRSIFKKYLKYIQKFKPKMTNEASKYLKEKYIKVRQMSKSSEKMSGMPIGPRHLKALKRLSQANAKLRMNDEVTKIDVEIAYNMFKNSLIKLGLQSEDGVIDMARIGPGVTLKVREKNIALKEIIKNIYLETGKMASYEQIMIAATSKGLSTSVIEETLPRLKAAGEIFCPKNGYYQALRR